MNTLQRIIDTALAFYEFHLHSLYIRSYGAVRLKYEKKKKSSVCTSGAFLSHAVYSIIIVLSATDLPPRFVQFFFCYPCFTYCVFDCIWIWFINLLCIGLRGEFPFFHNALLNRTTFRITKLMFGAPTSSTLFSFASSTDGVSFIHFENNMRIKIYLVGRWQRDANRLISHFRSKLRNECIRDAT